MQKFIFTLLVVLAQIMPITRAGDIVAGLEFGDSRSQVTKKLSKSRDVTSTIPPAMISRVGLNGAFKTKKSLKGLQFSLYFGWEDDSLTSVTYRSTPTSGAALKQAWTYSVNLLSAIHGKTDNAGDFPKPATIKNGGIFYSHEWKTADGYLYLGIAKKEGKKHLAITFSHTQLTPPAP